MSKKIVGVTVGTTINPKTIAEKLGDISSAIYTASKSVQITEEGIDTYTNGATLTVPAGTYIVTASAVFQTAPGSSSRNNEIRILSGSTVISRERIFTAAINYGELRTAAIFSAKESVTLLVQKSSSATEKSSGNTSITALRLFQSRTSSSVGDHTHFTDDIEGLDELLDGLNQTFAKKSEIPSIPDKVSAFENDKGYLTTETDPTVPTWAKEPNKPIYTASEVGADAQGTASILVSAHNTGTDAHNDIRVLIQDLTARLDAVANSSDEELDQLSEIVEYIKSNKSLIDSITTSKVNVVDIVDNLTTNVGNKPLSAAQGVVLKALIDAITVPTKVSQLENDKGYLTQHQDLSAYAKKTDIPTIPSSLPASGGNSDTVDGYHIRKTTDENDTGQVGSITFIV